MINITEQKFLQLQKELLYRSTTLREQIKVDLVYASDQGDHYRENFMFTEAQNKMEANEFDILRIEKILKNASIIAKNSKHKALNTKQYQNTKSQIKLGDAVTLKTEDGNVKKVQIVDPIEANPKQNKVSAESPLGKALIGKRLGDSFVINLPKSKATYEILATSN